MLRWIRQAIYVLVVLSATIAGYDAFGIERVLYGILSVLWILVWWMDDLVEEIKRLSR